MHAPVRTRCRMVPEVVPQAAPAAAVQSPRKVRGEVGAFYRKYTEAVLRRYVKLSMEAGRTPSLLGREMFRGKVTSYKVHSFEDVVIFVHDVGQCMAKLDSGQQHLVRRVALQEYTQSEAAAMTGTDPADALGGRYGEAIDVLTTLFLERNLLEPMAVSLSSSPKICQEGEEPRKTL